MKKKSPPYAIILAIVVGFLGIFLLFKWKQSMDQQQADALKKLQDTEDAKIADLQTKQVPVVTQTPTDMRMVYYATQPVEAGARISPAFFEKKLTPNNILPDAYADGSDVVGFYVIRPIEKGDPLTTHNINATPQNLSERIPAGMRAMALPIFNADVNDTGGFVVDGDKVDLLFTTFTPDNANLIRTEQILQNVQVLFVPGPPTRSDTTAGLMPAPAPGQPLSITFMVTPEQAQALVFLSQVKNGHFSMILRGRNDLVSYRPKSFEVTDYANNLKKVQQTSDRSIERVHELQEKIQAEEQKEKAQAAPQGTTNETNRPSQPTQ